MRDNGSLSGREIELREDQFVISRTDIKGRINYVNNDFTEVSGFSEKELLGQPHNLIRHPDVPPEVFRDLWRDLQAGRPWIGVLPNRAKNGDAYWVEAHISPLWEKSAIVGYISMRRRPSAQQILSARQGFEALRNDEIAFTVRHGKLVRNSRLNPLRNFIVDAALSTKFVSGALISTLLVLSILAYVLASSVSNALNEDARNHMQHEVALVRAALASGLESSRQGITEATRHLTEAIYDAAGGSQRISARVVSEFAAREHAAGRDFIAPHLFDANSVGTVFARSARGFARVMSNALDDAGSSLVGSELEKDHPAMANLLAGRPYIGQARIRGRHYMTAYAPLLDSNGQVVGATAMGVDLSLQLESLKSQIRHLHIGTSGYYYIVDGTPGPSFGTLILHPYREDQKLTDLMDEQGHNLVTEMASRPRGEISYQWANPEAGETQPRKKLVVFETMQDPHWIIAGGSSVDEFMALSGKVGWLIAAGGLGMTLSIVLCILALVRRLIIAPLQRQVLPTFHAVASGRFDTPLDLDGNDEMARLIQSLESMRNRLAFENARERALARAQDAARAEAESLSRARAEFLANMSHEIRTPLNVVIGLAYLLMQARLGDREMEYVRRIEGAGKLLLAIINDILDFSKIDAGHMLIETAPFRLDEVLDNLSNLVRARVQEKNLVLEYVVAPDVPQALKGDALRLSQILINLVGNAIKFTADGSITVFVEAGVPQGQRIELHFSVRDTGIGMSDEQIGNLFRAFSQADSSVTRKFGGTGLGLVICKRLVEMMGGSIWVDSRPGAGSTFSFRLWLNLDDTVEEVQPNHSHLQVLVVDDNDLARAVLGRLLEKRGCTVVSASSGEAALDMMGKAEKGFDCAILDLNMPGMDGIVLANRIRRDHPDCRKLIMVTSEDVHSPRYKDLLDNVDEVIEKPVTATRIAELVNELDGIPKQPLPSPVPAGPPDPRPGQLAGLRLLVAEDVPTNQMIMRDLLESLGATVELADNGELALQQLAAHAQRIDLVLMDIQMPVMDGLEATRRIRSGQVRADIPIIALTAHALEDEKLRTQAAGMNDFLTKPIEPNQLVAVLEKWRPARPVEPPKPAPAAASSGDIPSLPGIDTAEGLRRMLNRSAMYERVLRDFHTRFNGEVARIREALAAGDDEVALRRPHSLKGTAGTIGAGELSALAKAVEEGVRDHADDLEPRLARLDTELQCVLQGIAAAFGIDPLD